MFWRAVEEIIQDQSVMGRATQLGSSYDHQPHPRGAKFLEQHPVIAEIP